ncbi:hypothetical protein SD77_0461 [Bacillus badius]|uniref:Mobile element protein n=1 Tax=Bacillus badius TaxID=1455 RepID=A0ABR5B297_BACBA|nr:hypothetical protein SD77_0461 [Bacillus badius]
MYASQIYKFSSILTEIQKEKGTRFRCLSGCWQRLVLSLPACC